MFEEDPQAAPKQKFPSLVLLAAGGVVVATAIAAFASMLAPNEPTPGPPDLRTEAKQATSVTQLPNGRTATVVVTVSTQVAAKQRSQPGSKHEEQAPQPQPHPGGQEAEQPIGSTAESTTTTTEGPQPTTRTSTSQPSSNPPTSSAPSTSQSSSVTTTATTTGP
ncbi:hypothetical protein [Saccharothrix sp. NRRL B-16314]|uniref:hypothetical protein n=1 Tax=Saccharothrix sp. NRRL B-16314 TaxID=1463825 RepID=UPI00068E8E7B|nr:hypothetical protein [Saccharothrix sp. NRRL B-16314]